MTSLFVIFVLLILFYLGCHCSTRLCGDLMSPRSRSVMRLRAQGSSRLGVSLGVPRGAGEDTSITECQQQMFVVDGFNLLLRFPLTTMLTLHDYKKNGTIKNS